MDTGKTPISCSSDPTTNFKTKYLSFHEFSWPIRTSKTIEAWFAGVCFGQKQSDYLKKKDISGFGLSKMIVGSGEQNVKNEAFNCHECNLIHLQWIFQNWRLNQIGGKHCCPFDNRAWIWQNFVPNLRLSSNWFEFVHFGFCDRNCPLELQLLAMLYC